MKPFDFDRCAGNKARIGALDEICNELKMGEVQACLAWVGSLGMPLNHLVENLRKLPRDRSLLVYCAGGYRSSIAASLLQRSGFDGVRELAGTLQDGKP